jgi:hypothetical protein
MPHPMLIKRTARARGREVMLMKKRFMGRRFNPERYGMICCPVCKGTWQGV